MSNKSDSGVGVLGLLGVLFVTLKLTHIIDWSWWYVLMPFYAGFVIAIVAALIYFLAIVLIMVRKGLIRRSKL